MTATSVADLLRLFEAAGIFPWVDGGWGVDALLGFLSVDVPARAAIELLDTRADGLSELLAAVGPDRDLVEETQPWQDSWVGWTLWGELTERPGVGATIASKLYARKRPRLRPIYDSVVARVIGSERIWEPLRARLQRDPALRPRLLALRDEVGLAEDVSALRVFDVLGWMEGRGQHSVSLELTPLSQCVGRSGRESEPPRCSNCVRIPPRHPRCTSVCTARRGQSVPGLASGPRLAETGRVLLMTLCGLLLVTAAVLIVRWRGQPLTAATVTTQTARRPAADEPASVAQPSGSTCGCCTWAP